MKVLLLILVWFLYPACSSLPAKVEYYADGKTKKKETQYYPDGKTKKYLTLYWGNGWRKAVIKYQFDGIKKSIEDTYYEPRLRGGHKTTIWYKDDGTKRSGPVCHPEASRIHVSWISIQLCETCTQEKHGCTSASETCIR